MKLFSGWLKYFTASSFLILGGMALSILACAEKAGASELRWVEQATVPLLPKAGFTLTEFKGKLWVIGGFGNNASYSAKNQIMSSTDGIAWTVPTGAFPFLEREKHVAVVFQDWIYIIGGKKVDGTLAGDMWRSFDGAAWEQVMADPAVCNRFNMAVAVHEGAIWITGGENAAGAFIKETWITYNGTAWMATLADFLVGRAGHRMVEFEGNLWVVGGEVVVGATRVHDSKILRNPEHGGNWGEWTEAFLINGKIAGLLSTPNGIFLFKSGVSDQGGSPSMFTYFYSNGGPWAWSSGFNASIQYEYSESVYFRDRYFRIGNIGYDENVFASETFHKLNIIADHGHVAFVGEGDLSSPDGFYPEGTSGYLVPVPDPDFAFGEWSGDLKGQSTHAPLIMDRDKTVTAIFESAHPVVQVTVTGNGRVSPSGSVVVDHGANKVFEIHPRPGNRLERILLDGKNLDLASTIMLTNVRHNQNLIVEFSVCTPADIQPNYVKVKTYDDDGAAPVVRYAIPDGFGSIAQTQLEMGGNDFLVSANIVDGGGLTVKEIKPFVPQGRSAYRFEPMECEDVVRQANDYYNGADSAHPDAENYAYSEIRYRMEPSAKVAARGLPGRQFSVEEDEDGHPSKTWTFGVPGALDFLSASELNDPALDVRESPYGSEYQLMVARDADGHFSQTILDQFGNPVSRRGNASLTDDTQASLSKAEFDIAGRLLKDIPPLGAAYQSEYVNTLAGELLSEKTPDSDTTQFRYDLAGRVRFVKSAKQKKDDLRHTGANHYLLFTYDGLNRLVAVSQNNGSHSFDNPDGAYQSGEGDSLVLKRFIYDALTLSDLQGKGLTVSPEVMDTIVSESKLHLGQLAAALSFSPPMGAVPVATTRTTATIFSYEARGTVSAQYLILPGHVPVQKFESLYDLAGKPQEETYFNGYDLGLHQWRMENLRTTDYDALERESQVNIDGKRRFAFDYQQNGALANEKLYAPDQTPPVEELGYVYTAQDWIRRIATPGATPRFKDELDYGDLHTGNIHKAEYAYQLAPGNRQTHSYTYAYDGLDRLTGASTPTDAAFASYGYDAQGRLTKKKEGASNLADYAYGTGNNRIDRIPGHLTKGLSNTYVYDPDGNLVLDRSKNMTLDYDALGQVTAFRIYAGIPSDILTWEDVEDNGLQTRFGASPLEKVEVAYDAFGQRVWKHSKRAALESAVAYAGGVAELASPTGDGSWTLAGLNHWTRMGLRGRREAGGEYFYLTDHIGSVRMGLNAAGAVVEGMDYAPYGSRRLLSMSSQGVARQGYTEKEEDQETRLTYFGARYLDAELGSWTAADPMGQYHNGYSFVGGDPINFVDPWGLEGESATPNYFPGNDLYIPSYPGQAAGMPTASNVQNGSYNGGGSSGPGGGGVVYLSSFGNSGGGEASQRAAKSGQDRTAVRVTHEDKLSPPDDNRVDVERQEKYHKNIMFAFLLLGPISMEAEEGMGAFSGLRAMTGRTPPAADGESLLLPGPPQVPKSSSNLGTIYVDSKGNAIPTPVGGKITGSPNGRFIQARDATGRPTGVRVDGGHHPASHPDLRAQGPHGHVPGITNPDGTPWLPLH